jgi:hypothetical protein
MSRCKANEDQAHMIMHKGIRTASRLAAFACIVMLCGCRGSFGARDAPLAIVNQSVFACAADERTMVRETLYFGRNRPGVTVNDAQWRAFVDEAVTPRFPDGFTVLDAEGHWRGAAGMTEHEASKMLIVLHTGDAASLAALGAIAADYKRRFEQEAVLRERSPSCVKF